MPEFKDFVGSMAMTGRIFFDANAGAPLLPAVRTAMLAAMDAGGNASSVHAEGRRARAIVEEARAKVAAAVGARADNVVFTSGATEAANTALTPDWGTARVGRLYVGATEHACVLTGGRFLASDISVLPVLASGMVDLAALDAALARHDHATGVPLVALMLANNETGVIHPVAEAVRRVKAAGGLVVCDAAQAPGRLPVDIATLGVDVLLLSAHKLGGPQGAGALVLADPARAPAALLRGGGQERRQRAGTVNVAAIAGFGVAAEAARHHLQSAAHIAALRDRLEVALFAIAPECRVGGEGAERLPNTTLLIAPGLAAETLVIAFDLVRFAVSAGSACSSGKVTVSHVLAAMGEGADSASGLRISLPPAATDGDVDLFIDAWRGIHARMRQSRAA